MMVSTATQPARLKTGDGWVAQGGKASEKTFQILLLQIHFQPTLGSASIAPRSNKASVSIFLPFPRFFPSVMIDNQARGRNKQCIDNAQFIGAQRGAGLRDFDDGIDQLMGLDLGRAPRRIRLSALTPCFSR